MDSSIDVELKGIDNPKCKEARLPKNTGIKLWPSELYQNLMLWANVLSVTQSIKELVFF